MSARWRAWWDFIGAVSAHALIALTNKLSRRSCSNVVSVCACYGAWEQSTEPSLATTRFPFLQNTVAFVIRSTLVSTLWIGKFIVRTAKWEGVLLRFCFWNDEVNLNEIGRLPLFEIVFLSVFIKFASNTRHYKLIIIKLTNLNKYCIISTRLNFSIRGRLLS